MTAESQNQLNKQRVWAFWRALEIARPEEVDAIVAQNFSSDHVWHGFDPIGELTGSKAFVEAYYRPLLEAFGTIERKPWIFFGGQSNGRSDGTGDGRLWVTGTGVISGQFKSDFLGIPASGGAVDIRWGEFCRIENDRIVETFFLLDLIDLMQQAGIHVLPPSRGKDGIYPPPAADDGILLDVQDFGESTYSLDHIRRFIFDGLNAYDESNLESMGMADFFRPDLQWYGPGGIGACLSFQEFETYHQAPWLHAFPDRAVQDLDALFAEGSYSGAPGWNGVLATHRGEYLSHPATSKRLGVNGLDWWKRDGEQYVENWVFVDMLHLFRQMGVDLLAQVTSASNRSHP